ncbi:MTRF1L release factor glutamine methyltransferase [Nasonia vitripennis]|uniref:peptide chain release factor N(5)-glutamine methyltransferase n=1 Tax=Nasonia vitripennis TaxID=7425 RepID=A0A7M7G7K3_NASVI|nr:MTRF1L release factor glutamine methyltransferase [Nasonia vitripennis]
MTRLISKRCINLLISKHAISWTKVSINNELGKILPALKLPVLFMCNNCDDENKKNTIAYVVKHWQERFLQEGIAEPIESIEHIVCHVIGSKKITDLINHHERVLDKEQLEKLELLCECRLSRMPVQYIIGEWDFRELTLTLEPPIFIPRPETEILVDFLLTRISDSANKNKNILEIGCGSGAISLSVLHSSQNANIVAIDVNPRACELTIRNAKNLDLDMRLTVLNAAIQKDGKIEVKKAYGTNKEEVDFSKRKFDFIVSNPPYIPTKSVFELQPEIKLYEDIRALDGGDDGLKWIEPILKYASEALNVGGYLILEVDSSHPERIKFLVEKYYANQLKFKHIHKDYCNKERIVEILKINSSS